MKKIITVGLLLFITFATSGQNSHRLAIKFKSGIDYQINYDDRKIIHPQLGSVTAINNLQSLTSIVNKNLPVNPLLKRIDLIQNIHFITLPAEADPSVEISRLMNTGLFEYVEKDEMGTGAGVQLTTPSDPSFTNQWALKNTGTFSGTAISDADIDMDNGWDITTGNASTIVCVLDAGFRLSHPELTGRIWQNPGEVAGNGIDDDFNGYIDDTQGWDWANNDNNPTDDHGHGTNVASIIAAQGNNAFGMAGINWNCKLMVGKILNASNSGLYSWWTNGIYYAVNKGAKVINMSVGGSSFSATMQSASDFAMANNVMIVACMHNQNTSAPYYPAAYSSVIAVGSTSDNDTRTVPFPWSAVSGSNYGNHIDLVAPGNNILGASHTSNTSYTYWAGTSQATPLVAGVISLMLALKPDLTFTQVMNIITSSSEDGTGNPVEDLPGWDQYYGFGRLNALAALNQVLSLIPLKFGEISAVPAGNTNKVFWSTYYESATSHFNIEYSTDRTNWQRIRTLAAAGNSDVLRNYSAYHETDAKVDAYYRIQVVNADGSSEYSRIAKVNRDFRIQHFDIIKITGSRTNLYMKVAASKAAEVVFNLYSIEGKLLYMSTRPIATGYNDFLWNISLSPGRYQLVAVNGSQKTSVAVMVK